MIFQQQTARQRLFGCIIIGLCSFGFNTFHEDIQCIGLKVKPRGKGPGWAKGELDRHGVPTSASAGVSSFNSAGGSSAAVPPFFAMISDVQIAPPPKKKKHIWWSSWWDNSSNCSLKNSFGTLWFVAANWMLRFFLISTKKTQEVVFNICQQTPNGKVRGSTWRACLCWKWKHSLSRTGFLVRRWRDSSDKIVKHWVKGGFVLPKYVMQQQDKIRSKILTDSIKQHSVVRYLVCTYNKYALFILYYV